MKNSSQKHSSIFRPGSSITLLNTFFPPSPCRSSPTSAPCSTAIHIYFHAQFSFVCINFLMKNFKRNGLVDWRQAFSEAKSDSRLSELERFQNRPVLETVEKKKWMCFLILWCLTSKSIILTASFISPWHGSLLHHLSGDLTPIHSIPTGKESHEAFYSAEFHFAKHPINIHTFVTGSSGQALAWP